MAEPIYLTHTTTGVSGTSALGPPVSFTGTISEVRVLLPVGNLSGETQTFDLYKNGVALATGLEIPDGDNEDTVTGLSEAATDDDTFQFYITAPVASTLPVPPYHFTIKLAETHVDLTTNQTVAGDKTFTGATDFGGATSLELPNSATPTVNADGEIAVDTSVADFSHGIVKVYAGEELGVVAMPVAEFATPTDGHVVAYNATNDEFELVAQSGGGVDTANSPNAGEWAKFTDADTIEGRTDAELIADLSLEIGVDVQAHDAFLDDIAALTDPGGDRGLFWDDSAGELKFFEFGSGLTMTDTTLSAAGGAADFDTIITHNDDIITHEGNVVWNG